MSAYGDWPGGAGSQLATLDCTTRVDAGPRGSAAKTTHRLGAPESEPARWPAQRRGLRLTAAAPNTPDGDQHDEQGDQGDESHDHLMRPVRTRTWSQAGHDCPRVTSVFPQDRPTGSWNIYAPAVDDRPGGHQSPAHPPGSSPSESERRTIEALLRAGDLPDAAAAARDRAARNRDQAAVAPNAAATQRRPAGDDGGDTGDRAAGDRPELTRSNND